MTRLTLGCPIVIQLALAWRMARVYEFTDQVHQGLVLRPHITWREKLSNLHLR